MGFFRDSQRRVRLEWNGMEAINEGNSFRAGLKTAFFIEIKQDLS